MDSTFAHAAVCTVLVVEDEPMQALDLQGTLRGFGYAVLGPTGSGAEALRLLRRAHPDLALLDAGLRHDALLAVAVVLDALGVPFAVITTGYEHDGPLDHPSLRCAPLLVKPYRVAELRRCVRLLQGADLETRLASAERRPGEGGSAWPSRSS